MANPIYISLSSSAGTNVPIQVEDGNFRLSTGFLEHRPVTSPPTNQKKVIHPVAFTPNFAYKNYFPKSIGELRSFEHEPPILLAWPCNKPFSAPNSKRFGLAPLCVGHVNLFWQQPLSTPLSLVSVSPFLCCSHFTPLSILLRGHPS